MKTIQHSLLLWPFALWTVAIHGQVATYTVHAIHVTSAFSDLNKLRTIKVPVASGFEPSCTACYAVPVGAIHLWLLLDVRDLLFSTRIGRS